jgi:hypothetical protein
MSLAPGGDSYGMRFLEVTDYAVRSAAVRLIRRDTPLEFLILPMVHIGDRSFYDAVTARLRGSHLIVAEGVGRPADPPPDPTLNWSTLNWPGLEMDELRPARRRWDPLSAGYRLAARFDRLGLAEQDIDYDALGVPVLWPDLTDEELTDGWRQVPAWQRALLTAASPLIGLHSGAFGTRRSLAEQLARDDEPELPPGFEQLHDLVGPRRDRLLMTALEAVHEVHAGDPLTVAVVYGAAHAGPITDGLRDRYGYGVRDAEWLTVFTL